MAWGHSLSTRWLLGWSLSQGSEKTKMMMPETKKLEEGTQGA